MKWILAIGFFLAGVGSFVIATRSGVSSGQANILGNLGASFVELSLALAVIGIFLDRRDKQRAIGAVSALASTPIRRFVVKFEYDAIDAFGKRRFVQILDEFRYDPDRRNLLSIEDCTTFANIYTSGQAEYEESIDRIGSAVKELRTILGWSFDAKVLLSLSTAGEAVDLLREIDEVGSDEARRDVCKYLLDVYLEF